MQNRRVARRFDYRLAVEIHTGKDVFPASATNLSAGGVGVAGDCALPPGAVVRLSIVLVQEGIEDETVPPLNVSGKVIWCKPKRGPGFAAGIRFLDMGPELSAGVRGFLERLGG